MISQVAAPAPTTGKCIATFENERLRTHSTEVPAEQERKARIGDLEPNSGGSATVDDYAQRAPFQSPQGVVSGRRLNVKQLAALR